MRAARFRARAGVYVRNLAALASTGSWEISRTRAEMYPIFRVSIGPISARLERPTLVRHLQRGVASTRNRGAMPTEPSPSHHPSGTLAIVVIYALLFVGGWVAMYLFVFLQRGHVTP